LISAIEKANEDIIRYSTRNRTALAMSTTIVAMRLLRDSAFEVAWVGDSRAYLWHHASLKQLSKDHSYVQELIDTGVITHEQARCHHHQNIITQALGAMDRSSLRVDAVIGELQPGDQILLCSDGLTRDVDDATIAATLSRHELSAQETVDQLLLAALEAGGSDNVTAVVVRRR